MLRVLKAVFWSFFGVRKGRDLAADAGNIKPLQVVIAGLVGAAIFVGVLLFLVHLVTH